MIVSKLTSKQKKTKKKFEFPTAGKVPLRSGSKSMLSPTHGELQHQKSAEKFVDTYS